MNTQIIDNAMRDVILPLIPDLADTIGANERSNGKRHEMQNVKRGYKHGCICNPHILARAVLTSVSKASLVYELHCTRQSVLRRDRPLDPSNQAQTTLILGVAAVGNSAGEDLLQFSNGHMLLEYFYSQSGLRCLALSHIVRYNDGSRLEKRPNVQCHEVLMRLLGNIYIPGSSIVPGL